MQTGNLELILAWASILGAVLAAFVFLHREMRRGFERVDQKFDRVDKKFDGVDGKFARMDEKIEGLRAVLTTVQVSVARIEGHLGIGFPAADERPSGNEPPKRAA